MSTGVRRRLGRVTDPALTLERARRFAARQRLRYRTWRRCGRAYAAPIDPFRVVQVDPGAVTHVLPRDRRDELEWGDRPHLQSVEGGDWDLATDRFVETACYQALRDRFREGVPWHETNYATVLTCDARSGGRSRASERERGRGCDRIDSLQLRERYAALEAAYDRVATEGSPSGLEGPSPAAEDQPRGRIDQSLGDVPGPAAERPLPPSKRGLLVDVGRNGRLVLHRGRHELALARLADLEAVPVHLLVRHERWQARRDRLVLTGSGDGEHPDLAGLEPF